MPDEMLLRKLRLSGLRVAFAESCTGGMLGCALTRQAGASAYFAGSAVCYCNQAKQRVLGVAQTVLDSSGPVSGDCARQMAQGALSLYQCDVALSVTGFAGPDGERVGEVWIGWAKKGVPAQAQCFHFEGNRHQIRLSATEAVLRKLSNLL